jgi:hypothetical protein
MELLGEKICNHIAGDPPVSYVLQTCPKCLGKGTHGDISFDTSGKVYTLTGINQLKQQLKKILTENIRDTGYGFNYNLVLSTVDDSQLLSITRELNRCLTYFNNVQLQAQSNGFFYSNTEKIDSIESIDVFRDTDPRTVNALVYCKTVSGKDLNVVIPLRG